MPLAVPFLQATIKSYSLVKESSTFLTPLA